MAGSKYRRESTNTSCLQIFAPIPRSTSCARPPGGSSSRFPLHLVSSQPQHKLHSQMDAGPVSARGKTAGRETLAFNPADASERGIGDGEVVRVFNARGACFAGVAITDTVRPGVVRLSCGSWCDPVGDGADAACAHGNANVLTRDHGTRYPVRKRGRVARRG